MTVTIRWLGHAGFQIKSDDKVVYVDLYRDDTLVKRVPDVSTPATVILVTHEHSDHCDVRGIRQVKTPNTVVIAPRACKDKIGGDIVSLEPGEETTVKGITVKAVHAYNVKRFRTPGNPFHPRGYGVGYVLTIEGVRIYHAGDTDLIPEMKNIGPVDVALLPVGDTYTMDNIEAAEAVAVVRPQIVVPMHTWDRDTGEFVRRASDVPGTMVKVLQEDEEFIFAR